MEHQPVGNSSTVSTSSGSVRPIAGRGVWVLTAYGIAGLGMLGVMVYYFSTFVTH